MMYLKPRINPIENNGSPIFLKDYFFPKHPKPQMTGTIRGRTTPSQHDPVMVI